MQMGLPIGSMLAIGVAALISAWAGGMEGIGWRIFYALGFLPAVGAVLRRPAHAGIADLARAQGGAGARSAASPTCSPPAT